MSTRFGYGISFVCGVACALLMVALLGRPLLASPEAAQATFEPDRPTPSDESIGQQTTTDDEDIQAVLVPSIGSLQGDRFEVELRCAEGKPKRVYFGDVERTSWSLKAPPADKPGTVDVTVRCGDFVREVDYTYSKKLPQCLPSCHCRPLGSPQVCGPGVPCEDYTEECIQDKSHLIWNCC